MMLDSIILKQRVAFSVVSLKPPIISHNFLDMLKATNILLEYWRPTEDTTMSLLDLNDACFNKILKAACNVEKSIKRDKAEAEHWSMTCTQFKDFHKRMLLPNKLKTITATKMITLNNDKETLEEIIERKLDIVEVRGEKLSNSVLSIIDMFPCIKRLALRNSRLTGIYINELSDLEVLELNGITDFQPKNLSTIVQNNELRVLKLRRVPGAFTEHLAYEISQHLNKEVGVDVQQLEELFISLNGIDGWQVLGSLRYLKKLEMHIDEVPKMCEFQKCRHFFHELSNNRQLQELRIINGIVTEKDLEIIALLSNLKTLTIIEIVELRLKDFCQFTQLVALHLFHMEAYIEDVMEILCACPQLNVLECRLIYAFTADQFFAAISLVKSLKRDKLPVRVQTRYLFGVNRMVKKHTDVIAFDDKRGTTFK